MKLQIDTIAKTIKVEQQIALNELFDFLEKFLPNGEWKEYKLDANTVIYDWVYPIYVDRWRPYQPFVQYLTGTSLMGNSLTQTPQLNSGVTSSVYNIEIN